MSGGIRMRKPDRVVNWSGLGFIDATNAMNCPKCGAVAGVHCRTPSGRSATEPHWQRTKALNETGYTANRIPSATLTVPSVGGGVVPKLVLEDGHPTLAAGRIQYQFGASLNCIITTKRVKGQSSVIYIGYVDDDNPPTIDVMGSTMQLVAEALINEAFPISTGDRDIVISTTHRLVGQGSWVTEVSRSGQGNVVALILDTTKTDGAIDDALIIAAIFTNPAHMPITE